MASKLELLRIRCNRIAGMIDDIHVDEDCPENLNPYWGVYCCELCKHLVEEMHKDVYLKMPRFFRIYMNIDWLVRSYLIYPIQDAYYWLSVKVTQKKNVQETEPKEHKK